MPSCDSSVGLEELIMILLGTKKTEDCSPPSRSPGRNAELQAPWKQREPWIAVSMCTPSISLKNEQAMNSRCTAIILIWKQRSGQATKLVIRVHKCCDMLLKARQSHAFILRRDCMGQLKISRLRQTSKCHWDKTVSCRPEVLILQVQQGRKDRHSSCLVTQSPWHMLIQLRVGLNKFSPWFKVRTCARAAAHFGSFSLRGKGVQVLFLLILWYGPSYATIVKCSQKRRDSSP